MEKKDGVAMGSPMSVGSDYSEDEIEVVSNSSSSNSSCYSNDWLTEDEEVDIITESFMRNNPEQAREFGQPEIEVVATSAVRLLREFIQVSYVKTGSGFGLGLVTMV